MAATETKLETRAADVILPRKDVGHYGHNARNRIYSVELKTSPRPKTAITAKQLNILLRNSI